MDLLAPILDHMEDAVVVTDSQGTIMLFNKKALSLSQQFLIEPLLVGKQLEHFLFEPRKELVREVYRSIKQYKKPERSFAEYAIDANATAYLEFLYIPILEDSDRVIQVLMFIRDITQQKVFERKLVNTIENTRYLIETANAMIIGLDTRGYITDWNAYCTEITSYEKDDVYARKFSEYLLPSEAKDPFRLAFHRVLAREEINHFDMPVRDKQGNTIEVLTSFSPRYSSSGEIVGVILVAQDITELVAYRKSLEQQVQVRTRQLQAVLKREQETVELKSRFVSMASHEFRTPLNTLKYTIQKLRNEQGNKAERVAKIRSMEKQVDHMLYLLDDFLTYNKQEPGKINVVVAPIDMKEFLDKIGEEVARVTSNTHKIYVTREGLAEVHHSDEKLLRSIITNLLTNAIKFSPGKEKITVLVKHTAECLEMTITDDGIGMTKVELEKVFDPFMRGDQVANIPGTGLGLSIVKRAVSLLQGEIDIHSEAGVGTNVLIRLPDMYEHKTKNKSTVGR